MIEILRDPKLIIAIHILLYFAVIFDIPILRQCIGIVYLIFIPGSIIFLATGIKNQNVIVEVILSVILSTLFLIFTSLLLNTLLPYFGFSAPLSTLPLLIMVSTLTLIIFAFTQLRSIKPKPTNSFQLSKFELNTKGFLLCVVSVLLLFASIIGSIYGIVPLLMISIAGSAAILVTSIFFQKYISSNYFALSLFLVSLSLLLQMSLISRNIMGWDIFGEYSAYEVVSGIGLWVPSGATVSSTWTVTGILNSVLSVTILPTVYSTILNLDGQLVFKIVFPIIFSFVPVILFKIYESQIGKVLAIVSVFFFIADPMNLYGLDSISLMREMILYLFLSGIIFCFVYHDSNNGLTNRTRKILIIAFTAGLAVSHYSFAFFYVFFMILLFLAMQIKRQKSVLLDLPLLLCIIGIVFGWYMFVSSPPLNKLVAVLQSIASNFLGDFFSSDRLNPNMSLLSPTSQALNLNGLLHKIIVYIVEFFVIIGIAVAAIKPKEFKLNRFYTLMVIIAALVLFICLVVPNLAPQLNFSRFYRFTMVFLAPLFTLGGIFFLGLFKRLQSISRIRSKIFFKNMRVIALVFLLCIFFFFRSGCASTISNDRPFSYSLDFNKMKTTTLSQVHYTSSLYEVYFSESDLSGAKWLFSNINTTSLVYADSYARALPIIDDAITNGKTIEYISNNTQAISGSYVYLSSLNVLEGAAHDSVNGGYFNLTDLSFSKNNQIYSNGANAVYLVP